MCELRRIVCGSSTAEVENCARRLRCSAAFLSFFVGVVVSLRSSGMTVLAEFTDGVTGNKMRLSVDECIRVYYVRRSNYVNCKYNS